MFFFMVVYFTMYFVIFHSNSIHNFRVAICFMPIFDIIGDIKYLSMYEEVQYEITTRIFKKNATIIRRRIY